MRVRRASKAPSSRQTGRTTSNRGARKIDWEADLTFQLKAVGIDGFVREHKFHPTRKWRMDFAHIELKIGVEIMGGGREGRHLRYSA